MPDSFCYIPCEETGCFSKLVIDYLNGNPKVAPFYRFAPNWEGMSQAVADRAKHPINREVLVSALHRQYVDTPHNHMVKANIELLADKNTYTVCTAHQPNLMTGYLYFIYKILHAIKLAGELNTRCPEHKFVPVYYMGSEDNDLDELGTFRYAGDKYVWDGNGQTGAVGRMDTESLKELVAKLFKVLGPPGDNTDKLKAMVSDAYLKHKTIGGATRYLVNELFGRFGLVVLDPDDRELKAQYIAVMEDELLHSSAYPILHQQTEELGAHYKIQAYPREVNLFYLSGNIRERIERHGDQWVVLNTNLVMTKDEMLAELHQYPERFSPNVMLRGLYQETIMPNVAFIGGGAEVAYWMQLRSLFDHYKGFFPVVLLRQSVMWVTEAASALRAKTGLQIVELFEDTLTLENKLVAIEAGTEWRTDEEVATLETLLGILKEKAINIDQTLGPATEATLTRMKAQLNNLEKKMLRAEKRKLEVQIGRIRKLKELLFPKNSLQERVENFLEYYSIYGDAWLDTLLQGTDPLCGKFLVVGQ